MTSECQPHPIRDALEHLTQGLKRWDHRLKTDKRFGENGATLLINAKLLGRPKADLIAILGQPVAVQARVEGRLVIERLTYPSLFRADEKLTVECIDGLVGKFDPPLRIRHP